MSKQRAYVPHWQTPDRYACNTDPVLSRFVCPIKQDVVVDPIITIYSKVSPLIQLALFSKCTRSEWHSLSNLKWW